MRSVSVKSLTLLSMGSAMLLLAGCNSEHVKTADAEQTDNYKVQLAHAKNLQATPTPIPASFSQTKATADKDATPKQDVTLIDRAVWVAQKQQGIKYRFGGTSPTTGFDCSGFTQFAFGQGAGVDLPRTAAAQYDAAVKISKAEASKGDLVFFATRGRKIGHVGIYLGNNKFVHAPSSGKRIETEELAGYWGKRLVGFGRIPGACKPAYS